MTGEHGLHAASSMRAVLTLTIAVAGAECFLPKPAELVQGDPPYLTSATVESPEAAAPSGPYVPAGTRFTLRLLDAVGTDVTPEGTPFLAVIDDELRAPNGELVVAKEARVRGRVLRTQRGRSPLLALDLETVATQYGAAEVAAMLLGAQEVSLADRGETYTPATSPYDAFFSVWYLPGPVGEIAPPESLFLAEYRRAGEIHLPAGAKLRMTLRKNLVPAPLE